MLIEIGDPTKTTVLIPKTLKHNEISFPKNWSFNDIVSPTPLKRLKLVYIIQNSEGDIVYKMLNRSSSSSSTRTRNKETMVEFRSSIDNSHIGYID